MRRLVDVESLRDAARRILPGMLYDYVDGGSWAEVTLRANGDDLRSLKLRQRVGRDVARRSTVATLLGTPASMPLALAPTGLAGMLYPDGEIVAAKAAQAFGVPYVLPTMSICSVEDVAAAVSDPFWFQLYVMRDRGFVRELIARVRAARCGALVLTLDLPAQGVRLKDLRNGMSAPLRMGLAEMLRLARHPRWCVRMARTRRHSFGNLSPILANGAGFASLAEWTARQFDASFSWDDLAWIKSEWEGKLVLKGILDPDDAKQAQVLGCDALVVSNHGGRQLDGVSSSILALRQVRDAVGTGMQLHMDGGIRSGHDVLRALACGADAVHIGRPFLYGLAAYGEAGVRRCLDIIWRDLDLAMAFCGVTTVAEITSSVLMQETVVV